MTEITEFERNRISILKKEIIQDYEQDSQVKQVFQYDVTNDNYPDFIKIYQRPLVDRMWFSEVGYYPAFGSLGGTVARGEFKYIVNCIENQIPHSVLAETDFTPNWLRSIITLFPHDGDQICLLGSVENIFQKIIQKTEWNTSYDYQFGGFVLKVANRFVPLYAVIKETIGNNIIILKKNCCKILYKHFEYIEMDTANTLFVEAKPFEDDFTKIDILVYSDLRFTIENPELMQRFYLEPIIGEHLVIG